MNTTRHSAGNYVIRHNGDTYYVQKVQSVYGDTQWIIDTDTVSPWAAADTLAGAKATITNGAK